MTYDVVVVGGGIIGAATAFYLAKSGKTVCLVERDQCPSPRAASTDRVKVFRQAYPDDFYVRLAGDSLPLWTELEQASNQQIVVPTGLVLASHSEDSLESKSYDAMIRCGVAPERWTPEQVASKYPQLKMDSFAYAIYEPGAAMLLSERATSAYLELAREAGVEILDDTEIIGFEIKNDLIEAAVTESGERIECQSVLVAAGAWSRVLVPFLTALLKVTRQEVVYLSPSSVENYLPGRFPVFIDFESGYYLLPAFQDRVKIANHIPTAEVGQGLAMGSVSDGFVDNCRAYLGSILPDLQQSQTADTRICFYNLTIDEDFIIDKHPDWPNCWIATGFSGHGFKFAPLIGKTMTELLTTGTSTVPIDKFSLNRFWGEKG
jgi:N-methyl-L-tryptophan oxidase